MYHLSLISCDVQEDVSKHPPLNVHNYNIPVHMYVCMYAIHVYDIACASTLSLVCCYVLLHLYMYVSFQ